MKDCVLSGNESHYVMRSIKSLGMECASMFKAK